MRLGALLIILSMLVPVALAQQDSVIVRMPPKQSDEDASHGYISAALSLALQETEYDYPPAQIEMLPITYNQRLMFSLLNHKGVLDIVASAPSPAREIAYRSVRVPLLKGLLGYRMSLIRAEDKEKFDAITDPEEFKKLIACQGAHWPDKDVFEHNGFPTASTDDFPDLFVMLNNKECDYFPRAITEGYAELHNYNQLNADKRLVAHDKFLFHYIQPFLFYTSHENYELAARLAKGLIKATHNGKLLKLMQEHPVTAHVFPLTKWDDKSIIRLENPLLVKALPLEFPEYWITLANQPYLPDSINAGSSEAK